MQTRRSVQTLLFLVLASMPSTSASSWNVSCCTMFEALNQFTVERTGSSLTAATCRSKELECMKMKLIVLFIEQSRTILGKHNIITSEEDNLIHFHLDSADNEADILDLLAWAFLGRIVAFPTNTHDIDKQSVILQYDVHRDKLTIQRDSCQIEKTLYNTIIVCSVTLLIFFISAMIVDKKRIENTPVIPLGNQVSHNAGTRSVFGTVIERSSARTSNVSPQALVFSFPPVSNYA